MSRYRRERAIAGSEQGALKPNNRRAGAKRCAPPQQWSLVGLNRFRLGVPLPLWVSRCTTKCGVLRRGGCYWM
jgi:hypothetical protein